MYLVSTKISPRGSPPRRRNSHSVTVHEYTDTTISTSHSKIHPAIRGRRFNELYIRPRRTVITRCRSRVHMNTTNRSIYVRIFITRPSYIHIITFYGHRRRTSHNLSIIRKPVIISRFPYKLCLCECIGKIYIW